MTNPERAMQIWQILISCAHTQQSLTYGKVADYLGYKGAGVLSQPLDLIMRYCAKQGFPPLTCLVANKETREPGSGLTTVEELTLDREAVHSKNWFALEPVQISDFEKIQEEKRHLLKPL